MGAVTMVDSGLASWLTGLPRDPGDTGWTHRVGELVPPGYDAYIRVFHPFVPWDSARLRVAPSDRRTWQALASDAGVTYHNELMWPTLSRVLPLQDGRRRYAVADGDLEPVTRDDLFGLLGAQTPNQPIYVYYGLSALVGGGDRVLLRGSLDAMPEILEAAVTTYSAVRESPELVWPDDRSWVVCTDYDLVSTYVACSREIGRILLDAAGLETLAVSLRTRIDDGADQDN